MNNNHLITIALLTSALIAGCQENKPTEDTANKSSPIESKITQQPTGVFNGKLMDTLDSGGYTYIQITTESGKVWAAGPVTNVKKGDKINFNAQMPMVNFHSKSLNRSFDTIYFVDHFTVNGVSYKIGTKSTSLDPHNNSKPKATSDSVKIFAKAKDGKTIAEVLKEKNKLTNINIQIRGQVSKFTADVMGKNWVHIRDNSSKQDLTVTTNTTVALNDIILVEGKLTLNKDFGYGYVYDVIIENAKISTE